ncbi:HAMP domain-containing sensor histidine kinase [Myceligenerans crystallogenes]|uniref:histidine kinase n=1 Tax=Myceligenerans crystallogenes TaxID=316335 RepID=A0ABN2NKL1_9MICO
MRSVRARATLGATLVVAAALLLTGILTIRVLEDRLLNTIQLRAESTALTVAAEVQGTARRDLDGLAGVVGSETPVQVVTRDGRVLASSATLASEPAIADFHRPRAAVPTPPGDADGGDDDDDDDDDDDESDDGRSPAASPLPGLDIASRTLTLPVTPDGGISFGDAASSPGERFHVEAARTVTADGTPAVVYAAASLSQEEETVTNLTRLLLVGGPAVLVVVALVTWLVTGRALRPVEAIRAELAAITAGSDLHRRVPEPGTGDEIARLAQTTNNTLDHLQRSVDRQRRFVADASHELRSPIASLRTQLEVAVAHPQLLDLPEVLHDAERLQELAADLLLLARLDAGERPASGRVDLTLLAHEHAARRPIVDVVVHRPAETNGSASQLGQVLRNLLDNAERHAAGRVTLTVGQEGTTAVVAVGDDGPGVPPAERTRIFERFVRLDDARSRDDGGAGLGLAIARDVARRHGGDVVVSDAPEGGARFELRLPAARD